MKRRTGVEGVGRLKLVRLLDFPTHRLFERMTERERQALPVGKGYVFDLSGGCEIAQNSLLSAFSVPIS